MKIDWFNVFILKDNKNWVDASSEEWESECGYFITTERLGNRMIDDSSVEVYKTNDKIIAITTAAARGIAERAWASFMNGE